MGFKSAAVTVAVVAGLAVGVNDALAPKTPQQVDDYQRQQQVEQGSDSVDSDYERLREKVPEGVDAENLRERTPVEPRPDEPRFHVRFRP